VRDGDHRLRIVEFPAQPDNVADGPTQALAFSKCMRSHGLPNFPDRGSPPPSGPYSSIAGIAIPSSINTQSPAFQSATKACQGLLSSAVFSSQGKPPITAHDKASMIAAAQCMREHGVPNYPDPTFPASGGIELTIPPGVNVSSPAYKQAEAVCGKHLHLP
jgi:hypothetical protein